MRDAALGPEAAQHRRNGAALSRAAALTPRARRIETRVKLPPKLTADHKARTTHARSHALNRASSHRAAAAAAAVQTLMAMLGECAGSIAEIRKAGPATSAATVRALREAYGPLHVGAFAHFKEEEDVSLPLMRHHFTAKELEPVEAKMIKTTTPDDLAWVVRPLASPAAKREWMTDVASIPAPVQVQVMTAVRQRDARYVVPMKALCAGATEAPPPPQEGCACSVM